MMREILIVLFFIAAAECASADIAKLGVLVLDDITNEPVEGVKVRGGFMVNAGWNAVKGSPLPNECFRLTDKNGMCNVEGKTNNGRAGAAVVGVPDGYYCPLYGDGYDFKDKNLFGVWQPDDVVITLRVQRVGFPIPLFVKQVGMYEPVNQTPDIFPAGSDVLRFDMMKGEFLPPVGNGVKADVEFVRLPRQDFGEGVNGAGIKGMSYRDAMIVRFLGEDNGLVEMSTFCGSALKIRVAPEVGFGNEYLCRKGRDKSLRRETHYSRDRNFCFRIRTRKNHEGKIVEAYYGKIYGDISFCGEHQRGRPCVPVSSVNMRYYLNKNPMDRNLEWNGMNLCPSPGRLIVPEPEL
jgi:hypothetical protein